MREGKILKRYYVVVSSLILFMLIGFVYFSFQQSFYSSDDDNTDDLFNHTGDFVMAGVYSDEVEALLQVDSTATSVTVYPYTEVAYVYGQYGTPTIDIYAWNYDVGTWVGIYHFYKADMGKLRKNVGRGIYYNETPYLSFRYSGNYERDYYVCVDGDIAPDNNDSEVSTACIIEGMNVPDSGAYTTITANYWVSPPTTLNGDFIDDDGIIKIKIYGRSSNYANLFSPASNDDFGVNILGVEVPPRIYYNFTDNTCSEVSMLPSEKTESDYETLELCEENIVVSSGGGGSSTSITFENIVSEETNITSFSVTENSWWEFWVSEEDGDVNEGDLSWWEKFKNWIRSLYG